MAVCWGLSVLSSGAAVWVLAYPSSQPPMLAGVGWVREGRRLGGQLRPPPQPTLPCAISQGLYSHEEAFLEVKKGFSFAP